MGRVVEPLRRMGAQVWARGNGTQAPIAIWGGQLRGIEYRLPVASAQVKSALLLAGLYAQGETTVWEPAPSRDHTERLLEEMGAAIWRFEGGVKVAPVPSLRPLRMRVPGDFSSAAYFLVAALIHPDAQVRVEGVGINPTRTGLLDVFRQMGAQIQVDNVREWAQEPVADITATTSSLQGVEVGGSLIPRLVDEVPLLAVAACFAHGKTVIRDAQELRMKESDRLRAMARELRRLGAQVEELPDGLIIEGGKPLRGAVLDTHGDHRLAMALAVAGLACQGDSVIRNPRVADVSYPNFWRDLNGLSS